MIMASVAKPPGVADAVGQVNMIIKAAKQATTHHSNCERLANHVKNVGNLLEKVQSAAVLPAERMNGLEEALGKALDLVESCRDKSHLYMLAVGWGVVYQFRQVQTEIDRHLSLLPLISAADKHLLQEIEADNPNFTLDEEEMEAHRVVLQTARTIKDANVLEAFLSRRYPDLKFHDALKLEKEKLQFQLQRFQANNDGQHSRLIQHLVDVTDNVVNLLPDKKLHPNSYIGSGYAWKPEHHGQLEWQADLFDCCSEPCLSLKTCLYPCGTFQWIAHVVSQGKISREQVCNNLSTYCLFCGCCCYTCYVRGKLRNHFNIEGGACDDFLTHLMCCCCAMVQEWRELEIRDFEAVNPSNCRTLGGRQWRFGGRGP
ncbi:hypothetical protein Nepgr_032395 [Nepenthes gracilis]|uniref:MCAfunc domain-containing protein n=1 Tax=Nepenthes gracilis TaxID=150966 RepID=A0AAD3Y5M2_NEPGR|nr:hypothetical protein Nepgr_032395 [Nepenthes gracilis]